MSVDHAQILSELKAKDTAKFARHPDLYEPLLEAIVQHADAHGRLDERGLKRVERDTYGPQVTSRAQHRKRLRHVLQLLNETGQFDAALPIDPIVAARPSLAPVSERQARRQITAHAMDRYLDEWLAHRGDDRSRLLAAAIRLSARAGLGEHVITGALARMTPADLTPSGTVALPIDLTDFTAARYHISPPKACRRLLPFPRRGTKQPDAHQLLFPSLLGPAPTDASQAQKRQKQVRKLLDQVFKTFAADFEKRAGAPKGETIRSWRRFAHVARLVPVAHGVPPVFVDLLEQFPLPASATMADGAALPLIQHGGHPEQRERLPRTTAITPPPADTGATPTLRAPGPVVIAPNGVPEDWPRRVGNVLKAFTDEAKRLTGKQGTVTQGNQDELLRCCQTLLERADDIMPSASILHAALAWGTSKLTQSSPVKVSTLETYFDLVCCRPLLTDETADLRGWDDETIEELTARALANPRWSARTREQFMTPWRDFLHFAASINLLSEAEITIEGGGRSVGPATRTSIVTPHEFDYVWRVLHDSEANPISMQWGVALTLGYYGGLRASEVLGLTLQDIYCACGELWVLIRDGKTQAARRDIPLHWLAPPECVDQVERWRQRRRSSVGALRPQSVGLFGPDREPNPYDRHALITPLLDWLRPILGAGVDFHLLRHSTVSWLLLRLHAARHPGFRDRLHHRASWMFGDEALASILQLVSDPELAASGSEGNDLRYLAKLIGHRDVGTLLMHYSHTLGPIHDDHLAKAWGGRPSKPRAP